MASTFLAHHFYLWIKPDCSHNPSACRKRKQGDLALHNRLTTAHICPLRTGISENCSPTQWHAGLEVQGVNSMKNGRTGALLLQLLAACAHLVCAFRHPVSPVEGSGPDAKFGRLHALHPVQNCCMGETCLNDRNRFAVVTTVRSPEYMMGLRELTCSFRRHNPNVRLIVVGAASDAQGECILA